MNDSCAATVVCPLGHGLYFAPMPGPASACPSCGLPLLEVDDDGPARGRCAVAAGTLVLTRKAIDHELHRASPRARAGSGAAGR